MRTLTLVEPSGYWLLSDRGRSDPQAQALETFCKNLGSDIEEADWRESCQGHVSWSYRKELRRTSSPWTASLRSLLP